VFGAWLTMSVALGLAFRVRPVSWPLATEIALCAGLMTGLWLFIPIRSTVMRFHPIERSILAALVGVFLCGQIAHRHPPSFPVVAWTMYTDYEAQTTHFLRLYGHANGTESVQIYDESEMPGLRMGVVERVGQVLDNLSATPGGDPSGRIGVRIDTMLQAIGRRYNRNHPLAHIDAIEAVEVHIHLDRDNHAYRLDPKSVWKTEIQ